MPDHPLLISQAIHKLADYLCFQVKNIARELVDAFDLPDYVTRAPIGVQTPSEAYTQYTQNVGFQLLTALIFIVQEVPHGPYKYTLYPIIYPDVKLPVSLLSLVKQA